ncbi:MAG: type II and III secretion system protein [Acidobacteriaceae bacterium]|nr:type II and III secretion system protein [Acidobacteriaceae bacterium]
MQFDTGASLPASIADKSNSAPKPRHPSPKQIRDADDAYLMGAKQFAHKSFDAAQSSFERATQLNPDNHNYTLALLLTRETRITGLVQEAARARMLGETARSNALLAEGRILDPTNPIVMQYLEQSRVPITTGNHKLPDTVSTLAGPIEFEPDADKRSFHLRGSLQDIIRNVYNVFGIAVIFDPSIVTGTPIQFDVDDVDFYQAARILAKMSRTFAIPLQPITALIAKDTQERRDALMPLVEETIYLPGQGQQQLLEFATLARNMFDIKEVVASPNTSSVVLRGEEDAVKLISDIYADLIDSQSDILLDLTLYEIDRTNTRNIGFAPPTSATAIDVSNAAQNLISSNQTLLNESIANGALTLSGSTYAQELEEVEFLVAAGVSGSSTFTNLLGTLGSYQGVPLAGISVGSTAVNLILSSTDVRTLNALQIRVSSGEPAIFRAGSRYPILTSLSTSSTSDAVATELAAAGVSSAAIAKYGGSTSTTTVPQIQFEDLGLTLKVTPTIADDNKVRLALDFKIEAIGGTGVDDIPILNSRALASTVTVLAGETTMLATLVSTNETKLLDGVPDLNDLPGFQGTDRSTDGSKNELLITVTPHIVHTGLMHVTDHRLATPHSGTGDTVSPDAR